MLNLWFMAQSDRPLNVLFLMSDEHRADVAGYAGDPVVRTPTLDWLAETGTQFENCYAPSPICVPARQSLMAGQLPRTSGCELFGEDLPPFGMTWSRRLAQHAYQTVCAGKLHHMGADQMQGWMRRLSGDLEVFPAHIPGRDAARFERYAAEPGTEKWSNQKEVERAGVQDGAYQQFDRRAADHACEFLRDYFLSPSYDRPRGHLPLALKVSLIQPHYPYFTDQQRFEYYLNRVPIYFRDEQRFDHPVLKRSQNMDHVRASERDVRRATAAYYGMIDQIDAHFADVLQTLRHVGQDLDDWVIIYTSDHGEMLGEHGIWEKTRFFEASARVPLVVRLPRHLREAWGCAGNVVRENVNLCDLFATLCELTDVPLPAEEQTVNQAGLDSRSLVPLLRGETAPWHERYANETVSQVGKGHLMIKRDALKYQWYGEDAPEVLFDLEADPGETRNFADDPAYTEAMALFRERRGALGHGPNADPHYCNAGYAASSS